MTTTIINSNRTTVEISGTDFSLVNYGKILSQSESSNTVTPWLDTKSFPIIQVTASLNSQSSYVYWGLSHDETPGTKAFMDPIHVIRGTVELDSRSRWARIACSGASTGDELSYLLKPSPTGIKLVDDIGTLVSVGIGETDNALLTVYRDSVGILGSTNAATDNTGIDRAGALHTILTSSGGTPLASVFNDTLAVAPADGSGSYFHSTYVVNEVDVSVHNENRDSSANYISHNALAIVPTNAKGGVQGGSDITGYNNVLLRSDNSASALYYTFADASGMVIGSTMSATDSSNAVYVHLVDHCGNPHDASNPIPIQVLGDVTKGIAVNTNIGDNLLKLVDLSSTDYSANPLNLESLYLSNETATPVWFKIYDADPGFKELYDNIDSCCGNKYDMIKSSLKFNLAVPPLDTRDVHFRNGVTFYNGILARASNMHNYDASTDGFLYSDQQTFIGVNYGSINQNDEQLIEALTYRYQAVPDNVDVSAVISDPSFTLNFWTHAIRDNGTDVSIMLVPIAASSFNSDYSAADGHLTISGTGIQGSTASNKYDIYSSADGESRFPTPPIIFGLTGVGKDDYSFNILVEHSGLDNGVDSSIHVDFLQGRSPAGQAWLINDWNSSRFD
jgi:hypothetical protein